jgi:hypothetical protein
MNTQNLHDEINKASSIENNQQAIKELETILDTIETVKHHAEARVRILNTIKLQKPKLAESPEWLDGIIENLKQSEEISQAHWPTIQMTQFLIRTLLEKSPPGLIGKPKLELFQPHSISVTWEQGLSWLVYPASFAWPIVHTRVYTSLDGKLNAKSFWLADSIIDYSMKHFEQ